MPSRSIVSLHFLLRHAMGQLITREDRETALRQVMAVVVNASLCGAAVESIMSIKQQYWLSLRQMVWPLP
jgi:hypothetical protein